MRNPVQRRIFSAAGSALLALVAVVLPATASHAQETSPDGGLGQVIDPNQAQGTGQVVLDDGHIDFGPTLNTGEWAVQIHDDTSSPSYWRMPADVVARVNDSAKLEIPASDAYAFLGLDPGSEAWVIPQVREPGVIWAGWNTQEPNVLNALSVGTTLTILGVNGPGEVSVYLQSGNFGEPDPLWSTLQPFPQDTWIEANTHTHANWVFSQPGVYLVQVQFSADLTDGTTVSATDTLRFAVGDTTDPAAAFVAQAPDVSGDSPDEQTNDRPAETSETPAPAQSNPQGMTGIIIGIVGGVLGAAIIVGAVVIIITARNAKKRARAAAWQRQVQRRDPEPSLEETPR